ncbi:unnamed protein product [Adineta steineri]|uniref:Rap-GAP domain-containing protein n=1 Tax=Adineta steineri TaxID=433720 RepID=A0A815YJD7_9BILA|nr:unnamed protein product [Adineta steineri]CAF1570513.1 unnamed protein product [Adineta steineri]
MQPSQTTGDLHQEKNEYRQHKPVQLVRSYDVSAQKRKEQQQEQSLIRNNRSVSAGFRQSIRHLTSCALARRKPGRSTTINKDNDSSSTETSATFDENHLQSPKAFLIPTETPSLLSYKRSNNYTEPMKKLIIDDNTYAISSHKQLDKKNSGHKSSSSTTTSPTNIGGIDDSSSQIQSTITDDISLPNSRKLSSKEISTSLANLMGTASDSVPINNTTQIPTHDTRHTSSTPASSVDQLSSFGSSSNVGSAGMLDVSSIPQRTVSMGTNHFTNSSASLNTKSPNEYAWCFESSLTTHATNDNNSDEYSPRLEIDDKPLIYRQQFESKEHFNWYGISDIYGPVIISSKYVDDQDKQRYIMAIVRTRQRTSVESLSDIPASCSSLDTLRRICDQCAITDIEYFDPILCDGTRDLLIKYDESHVSNKHKFGIIYQRENQLTEEDIFSNETHSIAMDKFLNLIGNRVKLKDFQGFRGGLDNKSDHTGIESIYEQFNDHEIMFHVSTLLPHSKSERQQLERKRHIGNDIVAIVFQETETIFNPECIASQFLHVYLVITPLDHNGNQFKVSVIHRDSVPSFGPTTNYSKLFQCDQIFKQWLLTKLINAEMASCRASTFQKYQERTKMNLFENLYRTLHDNNRPYMEFISNHSQYKRECEIEQQRDDTHMYSSSKAYDRPVDNSLLGSVRRRFIAPKVRVQHTNNTSSSTTYIISSPSANNTNDSKTKIRSMTEDLKRSTSRESMLMNGNYGKMTSIFSSSKNQNSKIDKSNTNRPVLESENSDSSLNSRSTLKYLSPTKRPTTLSNDLNSNVESYLLSTTFNLSSDDTDHDNSNQISTDNLQSSSKDDLIKLVMALQQQHITTVAQLKTQLTQQNTINGENL